MLIVDQSRGNAYDAQLFREFNIREIDLHFYAIVAVPVDPNVPDAALGEYDTIDEAKDALQSLALAWETAKCYFMT